MNLLLLYREEVAESGEATLRDERARHVREVLGAEPGRTLRVGLIEGPIGRAVVESVSASGVRLRCSFEEAAPPRPRVDLLLAMPRPKVLKRLWAQLAALGTDRIVLINAARVERFYFDSHVLDPASYRPRLLEGLQQARCTRVPEVLVRRRFKPFAEDELEALFPSGRRLLAHPGAGRGPGEAFSSGKPAERAVVAIGPEGGWIPYEAETLEARGFEPFDLGPRILRTDTACVAMLALANDVLRRNAGRSPAFGGG